MSSLLVFWLVGWIAISVAFLELGRRLRNRNKKIDWLARYAGVMGDLYHIESNHAMELLVHAAGLRSELQAAKPGAELGPLPTNSHALGIASDRLSKLLVEECFGI